ncbi:hypothetical protein PHYSODRAFT_300901 [Phytophthora sojae]|uniref:Uncharacterized protein n=1 Tax=Phytophthora sojae (strain P6497) TaxID=1094619 RepID=G4ZI42_PHYSP|nr:hypothetical protein PHYSODRAFT_300901 [Phytophthora sojae]EGZ18091.1 hypothetical protein PHYSODRAFT_300901 [Phytophthora sojae]|eukprot:XP_009527149.1 hypothetical protein PHYSODRAFT_300901 [Phytophthora sojae]
MPNISLLLLELAHSGCYVRIAFSHYVVFLAPNGRRPEHCRRPTAIAERGPRCASTQQRLQVHSSCRGSYRISDARASRQQNSFRRATPETAVVTPYSLDLSGEFRPRKKSRTLQSVDEDAEGIPTKRDAFGFPIPLIPRQPSRLAKSFSMFGYSLAPLYDVWERLQVSHCGQYSVERMLALDEYYQRTSFRRVLAVCILMPLIPLLLIILMELVPLRPVEAGASANYVFWGRHALTLWLTALCVEGQAKSWIPELPLTTNQALLIASGTAVTTAGLELLTAELWVFPVPFLDVLGSPVFWLSWAIMSRLVLGPDPVLGVQDANFRVWRYLQITAVPSSLLAIYPAYQIIFAAVNRFVEMLIVSLLPVINVVLKNTLVACGSHLEDNLPELVVFTVDGFSALYSVICMRGTNSLKMVVATVFINVLVMVLSLHGMNRRSRAERESRSYHLMQDKHRELHPFSRRLHPVAVPSY